MVPVEQLKPNPYQPRKDMDDAELKTLAESIRASGILQPILARQVGKTFEIVAGESARGIMALTMDGVAIGNGILTVETREQAVVRADHMGQDKGGGAALAALHLIALSRTFKGASKGVGFTRDILLAKGGETV